MIVIFGVPGAGKTTVISKVFEDNAISDKYQKVVYGDLVSRHISDLGIDRDMVRTLPLKKQQSFQKEIFSVINNMEKENGKEVVLDTHAFVRTVEGFLPGLPEWADVKPKRFLLITADNEVIRQRMANDATRKRTDFIDEIKELTTLSKLYAVSYSVFYSAPLTVVDNSKDVSIAVNKVKELLLRWKE